MQTLRIAAQGSASGTRRGRACHRTRGDVDVQRHVAPLNDGATARRLPTAPLRERRLNAPVTDASQILQCTRCGRFAILLQHSSSLNATYSYAGTQVRTCGVVA